MKRLRPALRWRYLFVLIGIAACMAASNPGCSGKTGHVGSFPASAPFLNHPDYSPHSWSRAMLHALGLPRDHCEMLGMTGWVNAEGGNWSDSAAKNPLNTTLAEPGSWNQIDTGGGAWVQSYPNWETGFKATYDTITGGNMDGILSALKNDGVGLSDAALASPWGTATAFSSC